MGQADTEPGDSTSAQQSMRLLPTPDAYSGNRGGLSIQTNGGRVVIA